jgi:hypothetical protein
VSEEAKSPVSAGQALQSMRDLDFDCYRAYAEVIDNSIQAQATEINIHFETETRKRGYEHIKRVAFVDNGDGMSHDLVHDCLVLGYSSRYNDRTGIGRFGVGMTMGAIHECRHVEVFSRDIEQGDWNTTSLDISSSADGSVLIAPPRTSKFPDWIDTLQPAGTGTAVIWSDYDRQVENGRKIIDECKIYFGRVFRNFIWTGVEIFINGEYVSAIDPLYVNMDKTKFPNDVPASPAKTIPLEWSIPEDIAEYEGQKETITIKLSLLSSEIRGLRGTGGRKDVSERYINLNEGVSITRKGREVFYGAIPHWPGGKSWFEEIDRWWGCEIEFSPKLDRAFQVKNIKRGAVPIKELKEAIYDLINPTVKNYLAEIKSDWDAKEEKRKNEAKERGEHDSGHKEAEKIAKNKNAEDTSKPVLDPEKAANDLIDSIVKYQDTADRDAIIAGWRSQPYTIESDSWRGREFIELKPLGGSDVLLYNSSHPLMKRILKLEGKISSTDNAASFALAAELKTVVDLLLLSYVKAESKMAVDDDKTELLEDLRANWGMFVNSYINDMDRDQS